VADEDELRIAEACGVGDMLRPCHHIVPPLELLRFLALLEDQRRGCGSNADERDFLNERPVGVAGFESEILELIGQIRDRELLAFRARPAPFEFVGRKRLDVVQDGVSIDIGKLADWCTLNGWRRSWSGTGNRLRCRGRAGSRDSDRNDKCRY